MASETVRGRWSTVRLRRIAPEMCTDEGLEACSVLAALVYYRVISQADDQGRLPGHAKYICGVCFPLRRDIKERAVQEALQELVEARLILIYESERRTFLQVERWHDLQYNRRSYPSRYPAPPGWTDRVTETNSRSAPSDDQLADTGQPAGDQPRPTDDPLQSSSSSSPLPPPAHDA